MLLLPVDNICSLIILVVLDLLGLALLVMVRSNNKYLSTSINPPLEWLFAVGSTLTSPMTWFPLLCRTLIASLPKGNCQLHCVRQIQEGVECPLVTPAYSLLLPACTWLHFGMRVKHSVFSSCISYRIVLNSFLCWDSTVLRGVRNKKLSASVIVNNHMLITACKNITPNILRYWW